MRYGALQQRIREILFSEFNDLGTEIPAIDIYAVAAAICDFIRNEYDGTIEWDNPEPGVLYHEDVTPVDPRLGKES